jgi:hypothetical protein
MAAVVAAAGDGDGQCPAPSAAAVGAATGSRGRWPPLPAAAMAAVGRCRTLGQTTRAAEIAGRRLGPPLGFRWQWHALLAPSIIGHVRIFLQFVDEVEGGETSRKLTALPSKSGLNPNDLTEAPKSSRLKRSELQGENEELQHKTSTAKIRKNAPT